MQLLLPALVVVNAQTFTHCEGNQSQALDTRNKIQVRSDPEHFLRFQQVQCQRVFLGIDQVIGVGVRRYSRRVVRGRMKRHPDIVGENGFIVSKNEAFLARIDFETVHRNARLRIEQIGKASALAAIQLNQEDSGRFLIEN